MTWSGRRTAPRRRRVPASKMFRSTLISHIGIAVRDLDAAIKRYALITGDSAPVIEEVADQKVRVAIFAGQGSGQGPDAGRIELVAATSTDSPIARFLARNGEGLHHVCLYTRDITAKLLELKEAGYRLIDESPRVGAGGKKIAFLHPKSAAGVLIELEEEAG
jgi:methylmalonyl-CoA/ethylmalonyl-CoA epimerase